MPAHERLGTLRLWNFETLKRWNLLFLRCFEQWLTMCKLVVIIKQFREFESFEEIRTRLELGPGTPSLKRPAKTFAPRVWSGSRGVTRGYAGASRRNGTPPSPIGVRRGVTVVGDLVGAGNWTNSHRHWQRCAGEYGWVRQACARPETG